MVVQTRETQRPSWLCPRVSCLVVAADRCHYQRPGAEDFAARCAVTAMQSLMYAYISYASQGFAMALDPISAAVPRIPSTSSSLSVMPKYIPSASILSDSVRSGI